MRSFRFFWHDVLLLTGTEPHDFVICRECGRKFKIITATHLKFHDLTREEYQKKYPVAPLQAVVCGKNRRVRASNKTKKPQLTGTEPEDFVVCRVVENGVICGKRFLRISSSHLKYRHSLTILQYLEYPNTILTSIHYRRNISRGQERRLAFSHFIHLNQRMLPLPLCGCGCGGQVAKYGNEYIRGHQRRGRTKENDRGVAKQAATKRGRTALTHPGVKAQADALRGRTALTHPGIARGAAKRSVTLTGRTKYTHKYLAIRSEQMTGRRKETHVGPAKQAKKMSTKWQDPTFVESLPHNAWGFESKHHLALKHQTRDLLISLGFTVVTERWCSINGHNYQMDVYATRGDRTVIVEVGGCGEEKLTNLRIQYGEDNVFHIPYGSEETVLKELEERCSR